MNGGVVSLDIIGAAPLPTEIARNGVSKNVSNADFSNNYQNPPLPSMDKVSLFDILKDLDEVVRELERRGYSPCLFLHNVPKEETPADLTKDITVFHPKKELPFLGFFRRTFGERKVVATESNAGSAPTT